MISTKLSLALTSGRDRFEQANVHLEHVILSELEHQKANPDSFALVITELMTAASELGNAESLLGDLEREMKAKGYEPLPSFAKYADRTEASKLCAELSDAGITACTAADAIINRQLDGQGFYGALPILRAAITKTRCQVIELYTQVALASGLAQEGHIANELETNGELNFRLAFMVAYAQWNRLYDSFLASAAWSTEMWYQSMGYGSMVRSIEPQRMAG